MKKSEDAAAKKKPKTSAAQIRVQKGELQVLSSQLQSSLGGRRRRGRSRAVAIGLNSSRAPRSGLDSKRYSQVKWKRCRCCSEAGSSSCRRRGEGAAARDSALGRALELGRRSVGAVEQQQAL